MRGLLECPGIQIDKEDEKSGINAFWLAAFYGRGECLSLLANAGANIFCKHKET